MIDDSWFKELFTNELAKKKPLEAYSEEEIKEIYWDSINKCLPQFSEIVMRAIKDNAATILAANRKIEAEFNEHLWNDWSDAFDLFQIFLESCVEAGNEFSKEICSDDPEDENHLLIALTGLQARGCEIGFEIFTLLKNGYPDGAHARWRSLYEITVIAKFISENGNEAAKRYMLHNIIESSSGIKDYQKYCKIHGYKPFSKEEIDEMNKDRAEIIQSFGDGFKEPYGWASDILRKANINSKSTFKANFREIEKATKFEYMHGYYRMASHNVHAGSKALTFRLGTPIKLRGLPMRFGPSTTGFTDPAHGTSIALFQLTAILLAKRFNIYRIINIKVLRMLTEEIGNTFLEIDKRLQEEISLKEK